MKLCICSSLSQREKFMTLKKELEVLNHTVSHPEVDVTIPAHDIVKRKGEAIKRHCAKIDACDAILVTNYQKNGIDNYIGANAFLEMGYAFATNKKIFILHNIPTQSAYVEEIEAMNPVVLKGDISEISF